MKNMIQKFAGFSALLAPAFAFAVDDPVGAAVTTASGNVATYGASLVGLAAVGVGFSIGIKYVKKIARAA